MKTTAHCTLPLLVLLAAVVAAALAVPVGDQEALPVVGEAAAFAEGPVVLVEKREVSAEGEEGPVLAVEGQPFYVKSPPKGKKEH